MVTDFGEKLHISDNPVLHTYYVYLLGHFVVTAGSTCGMNFSLQPAAGFYCATQICISRTCFGDVAGWVAGWLSVTRRYCIKTTKPILKLFQLSDSPIILVSCNPCTCTQLEGNPFSGGVKYRGGRKNWRFRAIFDGNRRLSRKRCEIGRWLLWNVNRKSWVPA